MHGGIESQHGANPENDACDQHGEHSGFEKIHPIQATFRVTK